MFTQEVRGGCADPRLLKASAVQLGARSACGEPEILGRRTSGLGLRRVLVAACSAADGSDV